MSNKLIHEADSQPKAEHFLLRPRIENLLKEALQNPLTTVIAGAGYGKTYAVSSTLESIKCRYVWLQLSELDNIVALLWKRLYDATEIVDPELAKRLYSLGYPDSPASFYQLLRSIEDHLTHKERYILVLDDFHSIQNENALAFLEKLVTAAIPKLSVVLISRENVNLSLARMLSMGQIVRITEDDLRFTEDEMKAYFEMQGETLSTGINSSLHAYTEGWILAIYLVSLSLKRGSIYDQDTILRAKIDIFSLIEEEVYRFASKELRKFLIVISLLDTAPAELLRELAADNPQMLTEMADLSLLIRYDKHSNRYRMHRLFKDFLYEKMNMLTDGEIENTHLTAARWYRDHNQSEEAINHYEKCGRYPEIFDIIFSVRTRAAKASADLFIKLIDQAPNELLTARPIMRVVRAHHLFNNNCIQEAQDALTVMRDEFEALPSTKENLALLGEVYILLALISIVKQNLDFVNFFKKADECLPAGSVLTDYQLYIAEGLNITGIGKPIPGELKRYQDALFEAAPYAARVMNGCGYGMEYLNATDAAFMTGDIRNAEKYAYETIYRAQLKYQHGFELMANFYLIRIFVYKGDYTKIAIALKEMKEKIERLQNADCMSLYDIIEGWFFVKTQHTAKVAKWILREEETRMILAPVILGREYLVRSDCMLAEGKDYELLGFMKQTDVLYEQRGVLYARIQNKITESILHHYMGNHKESMVALKAAYDLSNANNLVMQYIEYGSGMRAVIKAALKDKDLEIPHTWLKGILTKSTTYAKRLMQVIKDYDAASMRDKRDQIDLSKRETEILTCICQGLTREEIAEAYGLSINTVKSTQKNIYNKLGALNSLDAVRIATMMGLV